MNSILWLKLHSWWKFSCTY